MTGFVYYKLDKRIQKIDQRLTAQETGVSSVRIWNFITKKADWYMAAGTAQTATAVNSPIIPVYITEKAYYDWQDKIRRMNIQENEKGHTVVFSHVNKQTK